MHLKNLPKDAIQVIASQGIQMYSLRREPSFINAAIDKQVKEE